MNDHPIGIFDSGLGGLSVWSEVIKLLPNEPVIYYADSGNCPYGTRPEEEIILLCKRIVDFLLSKKCKLIVVACNTATSAAIAQLRIDYNVPFIGMEPAVKPAALHTRTGNIGILATQGTLNGKLFNETKKRFAEGVNVHMQVGHGLVELVEKGMNGSPEAEEVLRKYIQPMIDSHVDHIVLGCTHYPFLEKLIHKIAGSGVTVLDPAPAVALQTKRKLEEFGLLAGEDAAPGHSFYTTGDPALMEQFAEKFLDRAIHAQKIIHAKV
jgi:glutamate racemase